MRRLICIVTLCFMIAMLFSGCGILEKMGFGKDIEELTPTSSIAIGEEEASELSSKVPVHLYFADADNAKLKLEVRYIPISEAAKSMSHLASIVVQELINGPSETGLKPTIPAETKLLPPVSIDSGVATVNLSGEFVEKHPGGKAAEQLTIYSIVNSLTELKDVSKVCFLVDGEPRKDLRGSFAFDMPFPRSVALISKEVEPASSEVKPDEKKTDDKKDDTKKEDGSKESIVDPTKSPEAGKVNTTQPQAGTSEKDQSSSSEQGASADQTAKDTKTVGSQEDPSVQSSGSLFDEETGEILE